MTFDPRAIFANLTEKERLKGHHSAEGRALKTLSRALNGWSPGSLAPLDVLVLCDQAVEDWLKARLKLVGLVDAELSKAIGQSSGRTVDHAHRGGALTKASQRAGSRAHGSATTAARMRLKPPWSFASSSSTRYW